MSRLSLIATVSAATILLACGDAGDGAETAQSADALLNGTPTSARPEVGYYSGSSRCTATLIRPAVVITAAHCVNYGTSTRAGRYGSFVIDTPADGGRRRSFTVSHVRSMARSGLGTRDIALLRLAGSVPASVATPTTIAEAAPERGTAATMFGYGCLDRRTQGGSWTKRKVEIQVGRSNNACPGDSGGPVVVGADGPIYNITSGNYPTRDLPADPVALRGELLAQIDTWDQSLGQVDESPETGEAIDLTGYYRLTNTFLGNRRSLDTYANDKVPFMGTTGRYTGQAWKLVPLDNGRYRLTNRFLGEGFCLDTYPDNRRMLMSPPGDAPGQQWTIKPAGNGTFRLINALRGERYSLDTTSDSGTPFMGNTGNYSGQYWRLTRFR